GYGCVCRAWRILCAAVAGCRFAYPAYGSVLLLPGGRGGLPARAFVGGDTRANPPTHRPKKKKKKNSDIVFCFLKNNRLYPKQTQKNKKKFPTNKINLKKK
ncbi:hypothetical protein, partial [Enterobacter hormaechei]